jgi:hypothetical protein
MTGVLWGATATPLPPARKRSNFTVHSRAMGVYAARLSAQARSRAWMRISAGWAPEMA